MWANWEIISLSEWVRAHNYTLAPQDREGFYGLDGYSLSESMDAIMGYLKETDPDALPVAEKAFKCFKPYRGTCV